MSASPMARQVTGSHAMPIKRVVISDPLDMPADYSSTPGGTLYSTTPGGSKIVYERSFMMNLRNSPISKTPPKWDIPENLVRGSPNSKPNYFPKKNNRSPQISVSHDDEQFHMDM